MHTTTSLLLLAATLGLAIAGQLRGAVVPFSAGLMRGGCTGKTYDYLMLVQQWAPVVCKNDYHCDNDQDKHFTLHGLWPNNFDGSYPCNCNNDQFNMTAVNDLLPELFEYWPSYKCSSNDAQCDSGFWGHEYTKHGTCMLNSGNGVNNEHDFFDVTLTLRNKYAVIPALAAADITPDSNKAISVDQLKNAYKSYYNATPEVQCEGSNVSGWVVCFDKSLSPMDCPSGQDVCPSGDIYLNSV